MLLFIILYLCSSQEDADFCSNSVDFQQLYERWLDLTRKRYSSSSSSFGDQCRKAGDVLNTFNNSLPLSDATRNALQEAMMR